MCQISPLHCTFQSACVVDESVLNLIPISNLTIYSYLYDCIVQGHSINKITLTSIQLKRSYNENISYGQKLFS